MAAEEVAEATTTDDDATDAEESTETPKAEEGATKKSADELRDELRKGDRVRKRESAKASKRIAELEQQLKEREDEDKSDREKELEKAREEAKAEALAEAEKDRRSDRLEVAVTREAARSFADTDDALLNVQRRIASGEIDADEIFDDGGKVQAAPLKSALAQLLEDKPHLAADDGRPKGESDGGRGEGGGGSEEDMSIEDHLKAISRH